MLATKVLRMATRRPAAVFLNSARLDYDEALDFSRLESITDLTMNSVDAVTDPSEIVSLVNSSNAEIVITKEMTVPKEAVEKFTNVKLLCEAGTGYNNIPTTTARSLGIAVSNIPTYSTSSVAHMVITYVMSFSAAMFAQGRRLFEGDQTNFNVFQHPIYEITGKTLGLVGGSGTIGTAVIPSHRFGVVDRETLFSKLISVLNAENQLPDSSDKDMLAPV